MEEIVIVQRAVSNAQRFVCRIEVSDDIFFRHFSPIHVDLVFCSVMDEHDMCPNAGLQNVRIA